MPSVSFSGPTGQTNVTAAITIIMYELQHICLTSTLTTPTTNKQTIRKNKTKTEKFYNNENPK